MIQETNYFEVEGLRFRLPNELEYTMFFKFYAEQDYFNGNEIIIKNCIHPEDKSKLNDVIMDIFPLVGLITQFNEVKINKSDKKDIDFEIEINNKKAYFKKMDRNLLRDVYNLKHVEPFLAWKKIAKNTFVSGDKTIATDLLKLASCVHLTHSVVHNKLESIKKK